MSDSEKLLLDTFQDALTKGDGKIVLAFALTVCVYVLREHILAKVPENWGRVGAALRWLGSTHFGGVVSSVLVSAFGATATAIQAGKMTWGAILNVFVIAATASGLSSWTKRKPAEAPPSRPSDLPEAPVAEPVLVAEAPAEEIKPKRKRAKKPALDSDGQPKPRRRRAAPVAGSETP